MLHLKNQYMTTVITISANSCENSNNRNNNISNVFIPVECKKLTMECAINLLTGFAL